MNGMLASALIGLSVLIVGLIIIWRTPADPRPEPSGLDDLRTRNADLERRVSELEGRLAAIRSGESAGA